MLLVAPAASLLPLLPCARLPPPVSVQGGCDPIRIYDIKPIYFQPRCLPYCTDFFWAWRIYLPAFKGGATPLDGPHAVISGPADFAGCGHNSVGDLDRIEFRADSHWAGDQWLCLDNVELL